MPDEDFYDDEELVATAPSQRNWLGIILALLVIFLIGLMILIAVIIVTPRQAKRVIDGRQLTLDDVLNETFTPKRFNGSWISGDELAFRDATDGLSVLNCRTRRQTTLIANYTLRQWQIDDFKVSPDRKFVLLRHSSRKIYRHSYSAQFIVYDIVKGTSRPVAPVADDRSQVRLNWAQWAPSEGSASDGGHALVMSHDGDLYYQRAVDAEPVRRVTDTAQVGVIFNGIADWVYEEEIFERTEAVWFNVDGSMLAYVRFNDSQVESVPLTRYGVSDAKAQIDWIRYPKAGGVNPQVTLWVVGLSANGSFEERELKPPSDLLGRDYYINDVVWVNDGTMAVTWMNRPQNIAYITECTISLGYCSETHIQEQAGDGWLERQRAPLYASAGNTYLTLLPTHDARTGSYRHVYRHSTNPRRLTPLTSGRFEVTQLLAWDEPRHLIYFLADTTAIAGERHLYRINLTTASYTYQPECLTCRSNTSKDFCLYSAIDISPSHDFYTEECLGPGVPWTRIFSLPNNRPHLNLTDNAQLRKLVDEVAMPQIEYRSVPLPHGANASVQLLLPPVLNKLSFVTYPVVLHIYGGPESQQVSRRWSLDWASYLASGQDMVHVRVDASGSGGRGGLLKHRVYKRLGGPEIDDQLYVLGRLLESEFYMDQRRVVVWGWSYGGYAAGMALARDKNQLLVGAILVAPVVDWRLYDSVYTERYMGQPGPEGNYRGYESSDLRGHVNKLAGRRLMVIHGTHDDNVHVQHTMMLSRALVHAGVLFQQQIYANENHGLVNVKRHLYELMLNYMEQCFMPSPEVVERALTKYFKKKIGN